MAQRTKLLKMNKQEKVDFGFCMVILIPIMLLFAIIRFIPIIETFVVSFFQKSMIRPGQKFNGIENYIYVLTDPEFLKALYKKGKLFSITSPFLVYHISHSEII